MIIVSEYKLIYKENQDIEVIHESGYHITLESNLTGHIWDIACRENPNGKSLVISHAHKASYTPNIQPRMHPSSIKEAQEMIKDHDRWFLEKKKTGNSKMGHY